MLDRFPQRELGLWVLCTLLISTFYFTANTPRAITPRATTPHLYRTGHHAFTTTAQLSRLCISRLPRQGLPRPIYITTCCHTRHSSYFIVYLSPAFTPPRPTYSAWRTPHEPTQQQMLRILSCTWSFDLDCSWGYQKPCRIHCLALVWASSKLSKMGTHPFITILYTYTTQLAIQSL